MEKAHEKAETEGKPKNRKRRKYILRSDAAVATRKGTRTHTDRGAPTKYKNYRYLREGAAKDSPCNRALESRLYTTAGPGPFIFPSSSPRQTLSSMWRLRCSSTVGSENSLDAAGAGASGTYSAACRFRFSLGGGLSSCSVAPS